MRDSINIPVDRETRAKLDQAGRLRLNNKQVAALRIELEEHALLRESELAIRSSAANKKHRLMIEDTVKALIANLTDLSRKLFREKEPFDEVTAMNDQILFALAEVDDRKFLSCLFKLKAHLEQGRLRGAKGGRPRDLWLSGLLDFLASLYLESGGRSTAVSRDKANDRKSIFIDFAWVAIELLPRHVRPHSKQAVAAQWEQRKPKFALSGAPSFVRSRRRKLSE
jgi:hypothetical protein